MQKNDRISMRIEDQGMGGEGIGHYEGMTFFVKDAIIGDEITAGVTKLKKGYGYARLISIERPSKDRIEAPCPVAKRCGGCQLQAMRYEAQLVYKAEKVKNDLKRIGGFSEEVLEQVMQPIVGMEHCYRYRNKAQFPCGTDKSGEPVFGFFAARTHEVIPIEDCLLGVEENALVLDAVRGYRKRYHVLAYDETTGRGSIRHVLIRKGFTSGELMVCLIVNDKKLPHEEKLTALLRKIPGMTSISLNVNQEQTNRILGDEVRLLWGSPTITDTIHRVREEKTGEFVQTGEAVTYAISPKSFYQVNPVQTEKLYSIALDFADLHGEEIVWDLYCGIGTISLFLAKHAKHVYGVEVIPEAIADARENALANGIENATFYVGKAEDVIPKWGEGHPDVIVVDPPRKGCDRVCIDTMLAMAPSRIVYVSCDPATLARDLRLLTEGGYVLRAVRPVDQFCHSVHVETCVLLTRISAAKH